jgi:AraC family transcriptional regulator, alkane utilization regulator
MVDELNPGVLPAHTILFCVAQGLELLLWHQYNWYRSGLSITVRLYFLAIRPRIEVLMDVLTDVLNSLRLRSTLYCRSELCAPWGLYFGPTQVATFHVIDHGNCWLRLDGQAELTSLAGGDLIVLPHGCGHLISDQPDSPAQAMIQLDRDVPRECQVRRYAGGGTHTTLLCGLFDFEHADSHPLLAWLPPLVHIKGVQGRAVPWLDTTLKFLASEAGSQRPGAETIVRRLTDVLFVQAIRAWVEQEADGSHSWVQALQDRDIGAALQLMHSKPAYPWTVARLAAEVALSRSTFASRFRALVGESPLHYLTRWRMQTAAQLLHSGSCGVLDVAQRVGYESEVAFSKAFKRTMGVSPGVFRRQARQARVIA